MPKFEYNAKIEPWLHATVEADDEDEAFCKLCEGVSIDVKVGNGGYNRLLGVDVDDGIDKAGFCSDIEYIEWELEEE